VTVIHVTIMQLSLLKPLYYSMLIVKVTV
jgi:hypothetical protein